MEIALRAAGAAIGVASEPRQNVLAVGLLTCERVLDELDERTPGTLRLGTRLALDAVPSSERWARAFMIRSSRASTMRFAREAGPAIVSLSVEGIAEACVADMDDRLYELLAGAIEECRTWAGFGPLPDDALRAEAWLPVCRPAPR